MTHRTVSRFAPISAAAARYNVHPRTIRRRIADGTLSGYRVGRLVRVDLDECDAVLLRLIPTADGAA